MSGTGIECQWNRMDWNRMSGMEGTGIECQGLELKRMSGTRREWGLE